MKKLVLVLFAALSLSSAWVVRAEPRPAATPASLSPAQIASILGFAAPAADGAKPAAATACISFDCAYTCTQCPCADCQSICGASCPATCGHIARGCGPFAACICR
jgi:hypothetical protein